jgi:hypothetical protein
LFDFAAELLFTLVVFRDELQFRAVKRGDAALLEPGDDTTFVDVLDGEAATVDHRGPGAGEEPR